MWRVAMEFPPHLSSSYLEARANFHKVLMGVSQQRARWQQCIDFVNDKMGMATGQSQSLLTLATWILLLPNMAPSLDLIEWVNNYY